MEWTGSGPANASVATCKNATYIVKPTNPTPASNHIYDPVMHIADKTQLIPDHEHHVTQTEQGTTVPTPDAGPTYDEYTGNKMAGTQWKKLQTTYNMDPAVV